MALRLAGERYSSEGVFDTVTITDGAGHYLQVPKLTTAQRDALAPTKGMIIHNTTNGQFEWYQGEAWTGVIAQSLLTTQGDIIVRGVSAAERLAIGAKRFFPRVNGAGDGLEYAKGYEFGPTMREWQSETAFYDWTTTLTGSGAVVFQDYGRLWLETGTTQNSTARGRGYNHSWFQYDLLDIEWRVCMFHRFGQANGKMWLKLDVDTADDPTDKAIGWRIDAGAIKGIVHDGTDLHVVDLNLTLGDYAGVFFFLRFIHGSKVEWYVNGVKKGESTDIPTAPRAADVHCVFAMKNTEAAANLRSGIHSHAWISDFGG